MSTFQKVFTFSVLLACAILCSGLSQPERSCKRRCTIQRKCAAEGKKVYATDGTSCFVFANDCIFEQTNCDRVNSCLDELKKICRKKCLKRYRKPCEKIYSPVCARYGTEFKTFGNKCMLENEPDWIHVRDGECDDVVDNCSN